MLSYAAVNQNRFSSNYGRGGTFVHNHLRYSGVRKVDVIVMISVGIVVLISECRYSRGGITSVVAVL